APGHAGELVVGTVSGKEVAVMNGRMHYYEGYDIAEIAFPVRVFRAWGVRTMIITNACGGLNPAFKAGDLMVLSDHINFMGVNPLRGPNDDSLGPRFPDMVGTYTEGLRQLAHSVDGDLREGIYVAVAGPNFETPAELRMLRGFGADAVGMSTVPEVLVARHMGMDILAISTVTDLATGMRGQTAIDWASPRGAALYVEPDAEPYRLTGGVILKMNASLIGAHGPVGRGTRHSSKARPVGSVFATDDLGEPLLIVEHATQVRGIQFWYPKQTLSDPEKIIAYPP